MKLILELVEKYVSISGNTIIDTILFAFIGLVSLSNPSKKQIVRTALIDLGIEGDNSKTLYQLMHQLEKSVLKQQKTT